MFGMIHIDGRRQLATCVTTSALRARVPPTLPRGVTPLHQVFDMPISVALYRNVLGSEVVASGRSVASLSFGQLAA